jgi:TctA family transporter
MGWENLFLGFQVALQPSNLALAVLGITLGTIIGVLPVSAGPTAWRSCCRSRSR